MFYKKLPVFAILFTVLSFFSACSKDDVTATETKELSGAWSITGIKSDLANDWNGDGIKETDILGTYSACDRKIALEFNSGGNGRISEGCDAPFEAFNWQLSADRLFMQIQSGDIDLALRQFTSNTIKGTTNAFVNGTTYQITYTLTRLQRG